MKKTNTANFAPVALIRHIREMQSKIDDLTEKFDESMGIVEGDRPLVINDFNMLVDKIEERDKIIAKLKNQYFDLINTKHISIEPDRDLELKNRKLEADKSIYKMTIQLQDEKIRRLEHKNREQYSKINELEKIIKVRDENAYRREQQIREVIEQRNEAWEIKEGLTAEGLSLARNIDKAIIFIDEENKRKGNYIARELCRKIKDLLNGKYPKESDKFKVS